MDAERGSQYRCVTGVEEPCELCQLVCDRDAFPKATSLLTKGTVNRVCEAIADRQLPLGRDDETQCRDKEEIGDVNIRGRHTTPFHETQRKSGQCGRESANRQTDLGLKLVCDLFH